jgi:hypothetical protein
MPEGGYQIRDQYAIHFITFAVVEWVDVFTRRDYADIVLESLPALRNLQFRSLIVGFLIRVKYL